MNRTYFVPHREKRETILIPFTSKAIDTLKLKSVFLDKKIQNLLPEKIVDFLPLSVRFSFDVPLGRKISNYGSFLKNLDSEALKNLVNKNCNCNDSHFVYEPHGHIITGDMSFVKNSTLRELMTKDTKYREPRFVE